MSLSIEKQVARFDGRDSFAVIYLTKGSLSADVSGVRRVLTAPCCVCLSEKETFCFDVSGCEGITVRFLPSHLNSTLTFDNLSGGKTGMSESAVLDRYFLRPFIERDDSFPGFFSPGPQTDIAIRSRLGRLAADHEDSASPFWPCRRRSSLMELLMILVSAYRDGAPIAAGSVGADELCVRVASWLSVNYSEKVTVAQLCGIFDINRTDLSQRFRAATGSTLIDYLSRVRVGMACRLLRETKLPAGEILYRVGFNDAAHFSRTFKKVTGITPASYRAAAAKA